MSVSLYMDVHVDFAITQGLRRRGVAVLTAQEDGTDQLADPDLLDRATGMGFALFTQDKDFLVEAARRQIAGILFAGVIFAEQIGVAIGQCVNDLELIAKAYEPIDMLNRLEYLPL